MTERQRDNPEAGRWLRWLRRDQELTQEKLAEHASTTVDTIASIESARRRPSPEMIGKILECLAVPKEPEEWFNNHVRWFRKLTLPEDWEPWRAKEWQVAEASDNRHLSSPNTPYKHKDLLILLAVISILVFAGFVVLWLNLGEKGSTGVSPLVTTVTISPSGIEKFVGRVCKPFYYSTDQQRTTIEVCAWVNIDYDMHRVRGRATARHVEGPEVSLGLPHPRLKQAGNIVSEFEGSSSHDASTVEVYTKVFNCGQGWSVATEVDVTVKYHDGHEQIYTVTSDEVVPQC